MYAKITTFASPDFFLLIQIFFLDVSYKIGEQKWIKIGLSDFEKLEPELDGNFPFFVKTWSCFYTEANI